MRNFAIIFAHFVCFFSEFLAVINVRVVYSFSFFGDFITTLY